MPTIPVPDVIQAELIYTVGSDVMENVLHYHSPIAQTASTLTGFAVALYAEWITNLKPSICATVFLRNIKVTDLTTPTSPTITFGSGLPAAGGLAITPFPNNVTCAFTKRTAKRGRSNRGRLYFPCLATSDVTLNVVAPSRVTAILNGLNAMRGITAGSDNYDMVVVSRYFEKNPRPSGVYEPVIEFTSDGIVDSQRRRLPGRGQ